MAGIDWRLDRDASAAPTPHTTTQSGQSIPGAAE